jgi:hypothetical protein
MKETFKLDHFIELKKERDEELRHKYLDIIDLPSKLPLGNENR